MYNRLVDNQAFVSETGPGAPDQSNKMQAHGFAHGQVHKVQSGLRRSAAAAESQRDGAAELFEASEAQIRYRAYRCAQSGCSWGRQTLGHGAVGTAFTPRGFPAHHAVIACVGPSKTCCPLPCLAMVAAHWRQPLPPPGLSTGAMKRTGTRQNGASTPKCTKDAWRNSCSWGFNAGDVTANGYLRTGTEPGPIAPGPSRLANAKQSMGLRRLHDALHGQP